MWDRYDPRSDDGDRGSSWDRDIGGRGSSSDRDRHETRDPRDVFTRDLDLPRGPERRPVRERDRVYEIDGAESRALATIGAFRVVAESDLHDIRDDSRSSRRSLKHLEKEGLIHTSPLSSDDRAVTLTDRGRALLEVVTGHYRGAHVGAAGKSGFTGYLSIGCSVGGRGGGGRHPRIAEELIR